MAMRCRVGTRGTGVAILLAVIASLAVAPPPASSAPAPKSFVTMLSDPGDYIGQGQHRLFHAGNSTITVTGNADFLTVRVSGGALGESFEFEFAPPRGEQLHTGLYDHAQRAVFREAGRPGMWISGQGRGCNEIGGRFDIHDISVTPDGSVERLWLTYEQHCEEAIPALFGEVRIAVPRGADDLLVAPGSLSWPDVDLGAAGTVVPVTLVDIGATDIGISSAVVVGPHRADFPIRLDECSGLTLAPGESCEVLLRFRPRTPGPRIARLIVTDQTGRRHRVPLESFGIPGRTKFTLDSEAGDFIGGGRRYAYSPSNARIDARGSRTVVHGSIRAADGSWWTADFAAPSGDILAPGTYRRAHRYPFNGTGPGLDISGNGRGCNELRGRFTVTTIAVAPDGSLRHFGATFEQHCEGAVPALRGTFEFRVPVGDTTPPGRATDLAVLRTGDTATLSWKNPTADDFAFALVRYVRGATPPEFDSGLVAHAGTRTETTIRRIQSGERLAVAVYTVDTSGNVGRSVVAVSEPSI